MVAKQGQLLLLFCCSRGAHRAPACPCAGCVTCACSLPPTFLTARMSRNVHLPALLLSHNIQHLSALDAAGSSFPQQVSAHVIMRSSTHTTAGAQHSLVTASLDCRVRDFEVVDIYPFGIEFTWEKDGQPHTQLLFERNSTVPSAKLLTLFRCAAVATGHTHLCLVQGTVALSPSCVSADCTAPTPPPGCHQLQPAASFAGCSNLHASAQHGGCCSPGWHMPGCTLSRAIPKLWVTSPALCMPPGDKTQPPVVCAGTLHSMWRQGTVRTPQCRLGSTAAWAGSW